MTTDMAATHFGLLQARHRLNKFKGCCVLGYAFFLFWPGSAKPKLIVTINGPMTKARDCVKSSGTIKLRVSEPGRQRVGRVPRRGV